MSSSDNCAVDANGKLKDASEINWYHDGDDAQPLGSDPTSLSTPNPSSDITAAKSNGSGLTGNAPTLIVTGKRSIKATSKAQGSLTGFFSRTVIIDGKSVDGNTTHKTTSGKPFPSNLSRGQKRSPSPGAPIRTKRACSNGSTRVSPSEKQDEEKVNEEIDKDDNSSEAEAEYEQMQGDIEQDGPVFRTKVKRTKNQRTDDVRAICTPGTNAQNQATWLCNICKHRGCPEEVCTFTGNSTTMRTHIARFWPTHGDIYLKKCEENGATPHPRALAGVEDHETSKPGQTLLMGFFQKTPKWTREGLLEHIIQFVVDDDQAFNIVEKMSFRQIIKYQRPSTNDSDIPHRTKLREEIMSRVGVVIKRMQERFKTVPSLFSCTFDAWTSKAYDPYLSVTAHYIYSHPSNPADWELKAEVLGFTQIHGSHSGANLGSTFLGIIDRYGIRKQMGWLTGDNVAVNDKAALFLQRELLRPDWRAKTRRIRCMEHTVHLGARAFVEGVNPINPRNITTSESEDETDPEDSSIDGDSDSDEVDDPIDFEPGDVLGKLLALVNQIRLSPQAKTYFLTVCREEGLKPLELIGWVRTRWGSMYDLIDRGLTNKSAINKFCLLADASDKVPNLKGKLYSDYILREPEWKHLELIHEVLRELRAAQASFSSETTPTAWRTIPTLECLIDRWVTMARQQKFDPVKPAIEKGLAKLKKWYAAAENADAYFICLALDPAVKVEYFKTKWDSGWFKKGMNAVEKVFDSYYQPLPTKTTTNSLTKSFSEPPSAFVRTGYASSWMRASVQMRVQTEETTRDPHQELRDYFDAELQPNVVDPVRWWGHHKETYPTLARMARDYLAIQGSSVPSERAFSSGALTDTLQRNCLQPKTFEALQLLKNAYKTGLIDASDEAAACAPKEFTLY